MADKQISQLTAATAVQTDDLFVLEQTGTAKKLTGQTLENWLVSLANGHGGIQTIAKTGTSGLVDTYTITYADTTTSTFTVTNGAKGDTGDASYLWVKYSAEPPTSDADMSDAPDKYIGIYSGTSDTAPVHYTDYTWYEWKGATGDTGAAAAIVAQSVQYLGSTSGTVIPEGDWQNTVPVVAAGNFLWTRTTLTYNDETVVTSYSVSRFGIDGAGSVSSVNSKSPTVGTNNVQLYATDIPLSENDNTPISEAITPIERGGTGGNAANQANNNLQNYNLLNGISIGVGGNLDNCTAIGVYRSNGDNMTSSITGKPTGLTHGFKMIVMALLSTSYTMQHIHEWATGNEWKRYGSFADNTWTFTSWIKVAAAIE